MSGGGQIDWLRRGWVVLLVLLAGQVAAVPVGFRPVPDEAARVVIVANQSDPDSVELARFYADRRGIPRANIVALALPAGEEISWPTYVKELLEPLRAWLIEHDWLQAIPMDLIDDAGRVRMSISGHRISYLVTCRGVPLKIRQSDEIPADLPASARQSFQTNRAAVDSELAALAMNESRRHGFVRNPLFAKPKPDLWDEAAVVRVARLDGPSFPAARNLVNGALTAEQNGLIGRAIVDIGGPHRQGDKWFEETAAELAAARWPLQVDRARAALAPTARADGVSLYFGWYQDSIAGPFQAESYEFAPGAIALHLHSFSARSLRSFNNGGWVAPLVGRGVAATFGNVYEPYLEFTHHPHLVVRALLGGATLGEAAYFAMPALSWQSVVVGDPLYRPLARDFAAQWEEREALPGRLASYVGLRQIEQLAAEPLAQRLAVAQGVMDQDPSLALAYRIAELREENGDRSGALATLAVAAHLRRVRPDEWGLMAEVAARLSEWGDDATAFAVWTHLLEQELPKAQRLEWLRAGVAAARAVNEFNQGADWEQEIIMLTTDLKK